MWYSAIRRGRVAVLGTVLAMATTACIGPFEGCDDIGGFGIEVTVLDSVSGQPPPAGTTALLTLREGTYTEYAQGAVTVGNGRLIMAAAFERPGTYNVEVTSQNYRPWTATGVRVTQGGSCDQVSTVKLTARMQRI